MRAAKSWARAVLARVPSSGQLGCALLLHLSGPKRAKIAAVLERAAVATHLRILDERLLCVAFRSDLVNVRLELRHGGFTAHVRRRLAGAARDWVARAAKLDEKVACLILRRHIGARTFWISRRRSTTVSGCRVRYRERGSHQVMSAHRRPQRARSHLRRSTIECRPVFSHTADTCTDKTWVPTASNYPGYLNS